MTGRRIRARVATLAVTGVLLAACDGGSGSGGEATTDLSFVLFGDPVETAGYRTIISMFEEENPGISVTMAPVPSQDELLAKLTTSFAGGEPPDVFLINFRKFGQFAAADALEFVQPYLESSDAISVDDFTQASIEAFRFGDDDALACMPQNLSTLEVYVNVDLFEQASLALPEAGWTWDEFLTAAQALTTDRTYGVGVAPKIIRLAPFAWSNGGEVVDDPDDPTVLTLDDPATREALNFLLDLQLEHGVVPTDAEERSEDAQSRFLNGRLGMYLNSRRVVPTLRTVEDFTWDVAPLPVAPGGEPATILHTDAYCMSATSPHHDVSWRFIEFAMGPQGQRVLAESGRTVPSRLDVQRTDAFLDPEQPPASAEVFLDAADHVRATPNVPSWAEVEKAADRILEEMFYGRVDRDEGSARIHEESRRLFAGRS